MSNKSDIGSTGEAIGGIGSLIMGTYFFITISLLIINQTSDFPCFKAKYDQAVIMLQTVKPDCAEDVVGRVLQINEEIVKARQLNTYHFCDPYISDKYDDLQPIILPTHLKIK
jgi:hypothetical protein